MTVSIQDVRVKIRDTSAPYIFSDDEINAALADAADWIEVQDVSTACPKYDLLQKLVTYRMLIGTSDLVKTNASPSIQQVTEGNKTVAYNTSANVVTTYDLQQLNSDINDIVTKCKSKNTSGIGLGLIYDNY